MAVVDDKNNADADTKAKEKAAADAQAKADAEAKAKDKPLTAADAAKLVKRIVQVKKEKKSDKEPDQFVGKEVPVEAKEVLDFKDLGDRVCVVTVDGQKFYGDK
jgi:hypothetical protein